MATQNKINQDGSCEETVLVRNWDCRLFEEITLSLYKEKESLSRGVSAYAETWAVTNGIVSNGDTVEKFLQYRNS